MPKLQPALIQWKAEWPAAFKRDPDKSDFAFPVQRDISKHWARPRTDEALRAICKKARTGRREHTQLLAERADTGMLGRGASQGDPIHLRPL